MISRSLSRYLLLTVCLSLTCSHSRGEEFSTGRRLTRFQRESKRQCRLSDDWIHQWINDDPLSTEFMRSPKAQCPCSDSKDCETIQSAAGIPIRPSGEVYGFTSANDKGQHYNWTWISTVAWASQDDMMCQAHKNGARAVLASPGFNLTLLSNLTGYERDKYIQKWVKKTLMMVQLRYRDGIVFDYEEPMPRNSPMGQAYVDIINATRRAFHFLASPLQVATCVAWSPNGIDGRNFPILQLAEVSDLLYVMDYDTQSQITQGACIASANAPISGTKQGIEQYLELGVDRHKLILGVPWYGYQYPCLNGTQPHDRFCPIRQVPFRGVGCSDAAGIEVPYSNLLQEFNNQSPTDKTETGGLRQDVYMDAPFFNLKVNNSFVKQNWFDNSLSLRHKFSYARENSLAGVGPYTFSDVDPLLQPEESMRMWSSFDAFFEQEDTLPASTD